MMSGLTTLFIARYICNIPLLTTVIFEVKMRQMIQEKDEKRLKGEGQDPTKRLVIGAVSLDVRGSLKPKNKRSYSLKNMIFSGSSKAIAPDSQEKDEV